MFLGPVRNLRDVVDPDRIIVEAPVKVVVRGLTARVLEDVLVLNRWRKVQTASRVVVPDRKTGNLFIC